MLAGNDTILKGLIFLYSRFFLLLFFILLGWASWLGWIGLIIHENKGELGIIASTFLSFKEALRVGDPVRWICFFTTAAIVIVFSISKKSLKRPYFEKEFRE